MDMFSDPLKNQHDGPTVTATDRDAVLSNPEEQRNSVDCGSSRGSSVLFPCAMSYAWTARTIPLLVVAF